jgi:hypothetical protein
MACLGSHSVRHTFFFLDRESPPPPGASFLLLLSVIMAFCFGVGESLACRARLDEIRMLESS